jgi:hypothetical protein
MSGPSFDNIDRWLFEYVEGNLSSEQEKQLEAFLLDHPEFDLDLDSWQMAKVEPLSYEFPNQDTLYRKEKKRRRILPYVFGFSAMTTLMTFSIYFLMNSEESKNSQQVSRATKVVKNQNKNFAKNENSLFNSSYQSQTSVASQQRFDQSITRSYQPNLGNHFVGTKSNLPVNDKYQNINSSEEFGNQSQSIVSDVHASEDNSLPGNIFPETTNPELISNKANLESAVRSLADNSMKENSVQVPSDDQIKKVDQKKVSGSKTPYSKLSFKKILKNLNDYMGDEIGLKNTRDHQIHVPGLSQLDANFSRAGDISSTRFRTLSRAQWLGKGNQSFTNQMALDWFSKSLKSGFGLQGNYQLYGNGVIQNWNVAFIYSPKILLSKSFLIEPGIRYKMGSKILTSNLVNNINKVEVERDNTLDFYADGSTPIGTNQWFRDIGTSVLIHSKWFYIGAQADNLLRHQDNIYSNSITTPRRTGIHYSVNAGTEYVSKTGESSFSPYGYYEKFENREEAWGGFNFQYKAFSIGGALSNKSNFALSTGLRFSTFAFTYQFDKTYSSLLGQTANSHQISIMFNTKVSRSSRRYIQLK